MCFRICNSLLKYAQIGVKVTYIPSLILSWHIVVVKFFNQLKAYCSILEGTEQSPMGVDTHRSPQLKRQLSGSDDERLPCLQRQVRSCTETLLAPHTPVARAVQIFTVFIFEYRVSIWNIQKICTIWKFPVIQYTSYWYHFLFHLRCTHVRGSV